MKGGGQPEQFFAATPPWEAMKLLFKMSMVNLKKGKLETKLMFIESKVEAFERFRFERGFQRIELPCRAGRRERRGMKGSLQARSFQVPWGCLMNFLGQDHTDVQFATKQPSHKMATPTETDLPRLKRIARYLVEAERVVWHYTETDDEPGAVEVFVDSDWAGAETAMKSWSSTQGSVATSVAEAMQHSRELQKHPDLRRWQGS